MTKGTKSIETKWTKRTKETKNRDKSDNKDRSDKNLDIKGLNGKCSFINHLSGRVSTLSAAIVSML